MGSRNQIRRFEARDAAGVAALFADYMRETFGTNSAMSESVLLRDAQGRHFRLMLATDADDKPVAFAAWREAYDLHHAVWGGEIPDLFVAKPHRGRALSVRLVAAVARAVKQEGGAYLKGEVLIDDASRLRLLRRVTVGFAGESVYVSGRAFRELAALQDADAKTLLRNLPTPAMSREP